MEAEPGGKGLHVWFERQGSKVMQRQWICGTGESVEPLTVINSSGGRLSGMGKDDALSFLNVEF